MHIVRDSPLRDLRVILYQCAHVVVPDEEDSFKIDPEEELDISGDDGGDSEETDDDYVPEGGSGSLGKSDGEGGEIQEEGMGTIQRGVGKIQKEGVGKVHTKKGEGKIQKEGVGDIQKKGVGKVHTKKGVGDSMKEGVGVTPKGGEGSGMGTGMRGSKRNRSATPPPPRLPGVRIKAKMPVQTTHRAEGMVQ